MMREAMTGREFRRESFSGRMSEKSGGDKGGSGRGGSGRSGSGRSGSGRSGRAEKWRKKKKKKDKEQLEDQRWYHGMIPRQEVKMILVEEGQFLVRTSENIGEEGELTFVISIRHENQVIHIPIKSDKQRTGWRLEGDTFRTVKDLILHHYLTQTPLTEDSGAILRVGIKKFNWLVDDRALEMDNVKLGEGQFGHVTLGTWRSPSGKKTVAIKQISGQKITDLEKKQFLEEAKLTLDYKHVNVVRNYGVAADRPPIKIIMELCPGGSLKKHLKKNRGKTGVADKIRYCAEAAEGMKYLAKQPCIHRDLAARNCLLGSAGEVKISDFGMSRRQKEYTMTDRKKKQLPIRWTAPECVLKGVFSEKSDVWSFGVLAWEIFADGEKPWSHLEDNRQVWLEVKSGNHLIPSPQTPSKLKTIMKQAWDMDPQQRPSFKHIAQQIKVIKFQQSSTTS